MFKGINLKCVKNKKAFNKRYFGTNIGIIGCGNFGKHLIELLQNKRSEFSNIYISTRTKISSDKIVEKFKDYNNIQISTNNTIADICNPIFLTIKPFQIKSVCEDMKNIIPLNTLIISMGAGVSILNIENWLNPTQPIIRCMPNIPISVKSGIITYTVSSNINISTESNFLKLMEGPSFVKFSLNDEYKNDISTAVSGCGPAFFLKIIEYYIDTAIKNGLTENEAKKLITETFIGTLKLFNTKSNHNYNNIIKELIIDVASKGGATEKGLIAFDNSNIKDSINNIVKSAYDQVKDISKKL